MGRLLMSLSGETIQKRLVYNPEMVDSDNIRDVVNNDAKHLLLVHSDAVSAHMQFFNMTSLYTFSGVVQVGLMEGVLIKLASCAYKAVKQTFFNQLHDVAQEYAVSPTVVRKSVESIRDELADLFTLYVHDSMM